MPLLAGASEGLQCVALAEAGGDMGGNARCGSREQEQLAALLPDGCLLLELRVFMAVPCAQPSGCFMAAVFLQPHLRRAWPLRASGVTVACGGPRAAREREELSREVGT